MQRNFSPRTPPGTLPGTPPRTTPGTAPRTPPGTLPGTLPRTLPRTTPRTPPPPPPPPKGGRDGAAAVMSDIRRAPRLKHVDRSLIQDRSDATLYFGSEDVPRKLQQANRKSSSGSSMSGKMKKASGSQESLRKLAGGANGAIVHPVVYKRPPSAPLRSRPPSPAASSVNGGTAADRRPSSAMGRILSRPRSPSPSSANYQSVLNLFPAAARLLTSNQTPVASSATTEMEAKKVKRRAPSIPSSVLSGQGRDEQSWRNQVPSTLPPKSSTPSPLSFLDNSIRPSQTDNLPSSSRPPSQNGFFFQKKQPDSKIEHAKTSLASVPSAKQQQAFLQRPVTMTNQRISRTPAAAIKFSEDLTDTQTNITVTRTQASFEAKFFFHAVTDLLRPGEFGHLQKTYPSLQNSYQTAPRLHNIPGKKSLLI